MLVAISNQTALQELLNSSELNLIRFVSKHFVEDKDHGFSSHLFLII